MPNLGAALAFGKGCITGEGSPVHSVRLTGTRPLAQWLVGLPQSLRREILEATNDAMDTLPARVVPNEK